MHTRMKNIILVSMLILVSSIVRANEILISLYEYDPWKMVVGSDSPTFILYEDGTAIFWDAKQKQYQYTQLDNTGVVKEMGELGNLGSLESDYSLSNWTDQPTQVISFKLGNDVKTISIYGNLRKQKEVREKAPTLLLSKFDQFIHYSKSEAKIWKPEYLEVMIWPYEYAPEKSIIWPEKWPDINSGSARKRGDSYSIYLPYDEYENFKAFIATRNEKGAVEINGKKWAVSTRIPFPHETALNKSMQPTANASVD